MNKNICKHLIESNEFILMFKLWRYVLMQEKSNEKERSKTNLCKRNFSLQNIKQLSFN